MNGVLSAGTQVGPYRIEDRLGAGGMGAVYRAHDQRLQRTVALKQILPKALASERAKKRFRREARAAARLNHPSIIHIHDYFESDSCQWIVMEHAEGQTLSTLLKTGSLSLRRRLEIAADIADALVAAHAEGIIHRDLKASNILVTRSGSVKVLDFGLAKQVGNKSGKATTLTLEGQIVGTPHAMSPEQAMGQKVDYRSDLFSLGTLIYEMLAGAAPFLSENPLETMNRVCLYHPLPLQEHLHDAPKEISALVSQLLEKNLNHRPKSTSNIALRLRKICDTLPDVVETDRDKKPNLPPEESSSSSARSERRQVTVLCAELAAVDEISSMGSESLYSCSVRFEDAVHHVAQKYEGFVANILGHRAVLYFGYPKAQEDASHRAINAAHQILQECQHFDQFHLATSCGIHTGAAVILAGEKEQLALGLNLDIAFALQHLAKGNEILISHSTAALLKGAFELEEQEPPDSSEKIEKALKVLITGNGAQTPLPIYNKPLVARDSELAMLLERWRRTSEGQGQVILVQGEAGLGKSHLVHKLESELSDQEHNWLHASASSLAQKSPFQPFLDLLRRTLRIKPENSPKEQLARLKSELERFHLNQGDEESLLAVILSIPPEAGYPPILTSPVQQRARTLEVLAALFFSLSREAPLALIVEDLHWIDPSSAELLGILIEGVPERRLLLLMTTRPEFERPWDIEVTQLDLSRLAADAVARIVHQLTDGKRLPQEVHDQIVEKTDGIPLFVEELTMYILESGILRSAKDHFALEGSLDEIRIPSTLQDSLTARLDHLGPAKETAQLGATIGRDFSLDLLTEVAEADQKTLEDHIGIISKSSLIYQRGLDKHRRYTFRHALIQDAAYESLMKTQRQEHHLRIARALDEKFPKLIKDQPEYVAHHYTNAQIHEKAAYYWHQAGERSYNQLAMVESKDHFKKGLSSAQEIATDTTRRQLQKKLYLSIGSAVSNTEGYASTEVREHYQRALDLCEEQLDAEKFWILWGLQRNVAHHSDTERAKALAEKLVILAKELGEREVLVAAYYSLGFAFFWSGDSYNAVKSFEPGVLADQEARDIAYASRSGEDVGVTTRSTQACCLNFLGYLDRAKMLASESTNLSRAISHPLSEAWAVAFEGIIALFQRDTDAVSSAFEKALDISRSIGAWWDGYALAHLGWAAAMTGDARGIITILEGVKYLKLAGLPRGCWMTTLLTEAALKHGDYEHAAQALEECLPIELYLNPEVLRLKGDLILATGNNSQASQKRAESQYRLAISDARERRAKLLELKATIRLSRLLQQQGRTDTAYTSLLSIVEWFDEGLEAHDYLVAREMLENLRVPDRLSHT